MDYLYVVNKIPMLVVSVVLIIAMATKIGKEKGSLLSLLGAIGVFITTIVNPLVHSVVVPWVIENFDTHHLQEFMLMTRALLNLMYAASLILLAVGMFIRPVKVSHG